MFKKLDVNYDIFCKIIKSATVANVKEKQWGTTDVFIYILFVYLFSYITCYVFYDKFNFHLVNSNHLLGAKMVLTMA